MDNCNLFISNTSMIAIRNVYNLYKSVFNRPIQFYPNLVYINDKREKDRWIINRSDRYFNDRYIHK